MNIELLTIDSARTSVLEKETTATALVDAFYARIATEDGAIGAYLTLCKERAYRQAARIDALADKGDALPPLAGVPVAIKDVFTTKDVRTTAGSKILENFIAPYDATVVAKLEEAGAIILGKTNCDEFAMGSSNENSGFHPVRNPRDHSRVPGGSSGGSAAAVAAGTAVASLGSDTGGSIRQPAAFTGIVGVKPTYGRVSRYGLIAFASSLDQIGPFARSVEDAAMTYDAMGGHDPMDATSVDMPFETTAGHLREDLRGVRVGIVKEFATSDLAPDVAAAYEKAYADLAALGAELVEVELPTAKYGLSTYYLIAPAECSSNLARFDGVRYGLRVDGADVGEMYEKTRAAGFGPEVKRRILIGTYALSSGYYDAYYVKAQKARTRIADDFRRAFAKCDVIASPAASSPAFAFNAKSDPYSMYLMDYYTIPVSLAGLPSLSIPCGSALPEGGSRPMPLGLQLASPLFSERALLGYAHAYERATQHAAKLAPVQVVTS